MVVHLRGTLVKDRDCVVVLSWPRDFYFGALVHIFSLPLSEGLDFACNMAIRFLLEEGALLVSLFQVESLLEFRKLVSVCARA